MRSRYWKLTPDDIENANYDQSKVLNWDIKCAREPEEDAVFIGVYLYRSGTPYDYTSLHGISFYYNNISRNELPEITNFLKNKFGGKAVEKGERVILKDSKEIYSPKEIGQLAKEMETKFKTKAVLTIEFKDMDQEEQEKSGLPESKLLPIPVK